MKNTLYLLTAFITIFTLFSNPAMQGMDRKINVYPKGLEGYKPREERLFRQREFIREICGNFETRCTKIQKMSLQEISINLTELFSPIFSYLESEDQNECRLFLELLYVLSEVMLVDSVAAQLFTNSALNLSLKIRLLSSATERYKQQEMTGICQK